jgi:hypothetical protein
LSSPITRPDGKPIPSSNCFASTSLV